MTALSRQAALYYLLDFLKDEFRNHPEVRIRALPTEKEEEEGVTLRTETREYFFPVDWVMGSRFEEVRKLAREIRDLLGDYA